ncbi:MAG: LamG domain-containing protein [Halanaerobiales bacterium]|nr:LamG domain-containing protein [Halanaerobiales bacterium]
MSNSYLNFNGTDQYVTVPDNDALDFGTGDFSIAFWAKIEPGVGSDHVFMKRNTGGSAFPSAHIEFFLADELWFLIHDGTNLALSRTKINRNGRWYHYVYSITHSGLSSLHINGIQSDTFDAQSVGSLNNNGDMTIGCDDGPDRFTNGSLDDFRFYKKALSKSEIDEIYNDGVGTKLTGSEDGLSWGGNCDEGTGDTLVDITGTINGSLSNNVSDNMWTTGGTPFYGLIWEQKDSDTSTVATQFKVDDTTATVTTPSVDAIYTYTRTIYDADCDKKSAASDGVEVEVDGGVASQYPLTDPGNLSIQTIDDGKFYLFFNYSYSVGDPITHFNIYHDLGEPSSVDWVYDGTVTYVSNLGAKYRYTTDAQVNGTVVNYKVVPSVADGSDEYERDNETTVTGTADNLVPVVVTDYVSITLE